MSRSRNRAIWIATETGGYGVDPNGDGSGYLPVPAEALGDLVDQTQVLETDYANESEFPSATERGAGGAEISFSLPLFGLGTAAGDGTDASSVTDDVWDLLLTHIFGTQATTPGEGLAAGGATNDLELDGSVLDANDLTLVYDSAADSARGQLRNIATDVGGGVYTVSPDWDTSPTDAGVSYGMKLYTPNSPFTGGDTLSVVYRDSNIGLYRLSGGRVTSLSLGGDVNSRAMASITMRFDDIEASSVTTAAKTALPAALSAAPVPSIHVRSSPVYFNGVKLASSKINIDLGLAAAVVKDTCQANGRADDESVGLAPMCQVSLLRTESERLQFRGAQSGELLVQFGSGQLSSGRVNVFAVRFPTAEFNERSAADDEGIARTDITFKAYLSTSPFVVLGRG